MQENQCPWKIPDCQKAECYIDCRQSLVSALVSAANEAETLLIDEIGGVEKIKVPHFIMNRTVKINGIYFTVTTEICMGEKAS